MRILTFDIEDWFHLLENDSTRTEDQWRQFVPRIERNTDLILEALSFKGLRATFFCLGWVAKNHSNVIKRIHAAGHDIGSHSYSHQLITEQGYDQFRQDLSRSISVLEELTGSKIRAYRAPGFSMTPKTLWAIDALVENGIEIDSSVFVSTRAHGGFAKFRSFEPCLIRREGMVLKEFPLVPGRVAGKTLAFSGGGYFRLLPYFQTRRMYSRSDYVMSYFHPRDFDAYQPRLPGLPWNRFFKSYVGLHSSFEKFQTLLDEFSFIDLKTADLLIDWDSQPTVDL